MAILKDFRYHAPKTVQETLALLNEKREPRLLAGGTFLLNVFKKASYLPADVVSLRRVEGLRAIKQAKVSVSIGAMTTIAELAGSTIVRNALPLLADACAKIGTTPLRHMATIGGNIASRFFWVDLPAVLLALDAQLVLSTDKGVKTIGIETFLAQKPADPVLLTHIEVPVKRGTFFYYRHTKAMPVDIPTTALAFAASSKDGGLIDVRVALNTTLSFPVACPKTAMAFEGRVPGDISCEAVERAFREDTTQAKLDDHRRHCLAVDLEDMVKRLKGEGPK